jgi:hypothetical protein
MILASSPASQQDPTRRRRTSATRNSPIQSAGRGSPSQIPKQGTGPRNAHMRVRGHTQKEWIKFDDGRYQPDIHTCDNIWHFLVCSPTQVGPFGVRADLYFKASSPSIFSPHTTERNTSVKQCRQQVQDTCSLSRSNALCICSRRSQQRRSISALSLEIRLFRFTVAPGLCI